MTATAIPAAQMGPPAGQPDLPYRPACSQLTGQPGSVEGWTAWGVTIDGVFRQFTGLPSSYSREQANAVADAYGVCEVGGVNVPFSPIEQAAIEQLPPPQQTVAIGVESDPVGLTPSLPFPLVVGAAIVGAIAAINWIRENAQKRNADVDISPEMLYPLVGQMEPNPFVHLPTTPGFTAPEAPGYSIPDMVQTYPLSRPPSVGGPTPETPEGGTEGGEGGPLREGTEGGINPLQFCPLKLEEFPSEIEMAALTFCCYEDYTQNKALEAIYGLTNNNRNTAAHERAVARWKAFKKQWTQKYNLGA